MARKHLLGYELQKIASRAGFVAFCKRFGTPYEAMNCYDIKLKAAFLAKASQFGEPPISPSPYRDDNSWADGPVIPPGGA